MERSADYTLNELCVPLRDMANYISRIYIWFVLSVNKLGRVNIQTYLNVSFACK